MSPALEGAVIIAGAALIAGVVLYALLGDRPDTARRRLLDVRRWQWAHRNKDGTHVLTDLGRLVLMEDDDRRNASPRHTPRA